MVKIRFLKKNLFENKLLSKSDRTNSATHDNNFQLRGS